MINAPEAVQEYIALVTDGKKDLFISLFNTINENMPPGFELGMSYGIIAWSVPLETYPDGYHCKPNTPLPFISLASQKNFAALYHMGIYAKPELLSWFQTEWPKYSARKLDMGKSCIRFKNSAEILFELIAELCKKMSVEDWITIYEKEFKK
ncbi:DUF1801 domain-containing protein [Kaistella palustris]|uniref:DUF1801 domain-containing protein n=1 Tax=Kaistella palustris TaxID=493376 RepID=UPI000425A7A5|nr:DUF1801 domain-containing protein [Kaistella palustris]